MKIANGAIIIMNKILNYNQEYYLSLGNKATKPSFTLIILVLFFSAMFYSQSREFALTSALNSSTVESLINLLRMYGINAQLALDRTVVSSFPLNADRILEVQANGDILTIYEYTNDTLKGSDANSLSPDGITYMAKGKVIVEDYVAPAAIHFYKGPKIILKYMEIVLK